MNIFCINDNPIIAARELANRHVLKMGLESINMLFIPLKNQLNLTLPNNQQGIEFKITHINHPCSIWARESKENYEWLLKHTREILNQYRIRYKRTHVAEKYYSFIIDNYLNLKFNQINRTPFARCFGPHYENFETVKAYLQGGQVKIVHRNGFYPQIKSRRILLIKILVEGCTRRDSGSIDFL